MSYKAQRIRDPVHDLISFKANEFENALWGVLQTPAFQRLRRVKQLGFSDLVFPGATHSRFAHSVGVFHIARRLMDVVKNHLGDKDFRQTKAEAAIAAALVHDLGHGPFSHAFEEVGKKLHLKMAKHEIVSDELIRDSEVSEALNVLGSGFANDVADVLVTERPTIYQAVVSSQFDADRLDYLQRDRLMSGAKVGAIDFEWLLSNLLVGKVPTGVDEADAGTVDTFVVGSKAISAVESYVLGVFQMYPAVYYHKTTRGIEKLFSELLIRLFRLARSGKVPRTGLAPTHPLIKFAKAPGKIENFLGLDDASVWGSLPQIAKAKDPLLSDLATRLWTRRLYKCRDARQIFAERFGVNRREEIDKACAEAIERLEDWRIKHKSTPLRIIYDQTQRHPYREFRQSSGPVAQIRVQTNANGDSVDIADRSEVLRGLKPFKLFRVYFRDEDDGAREFVDKTISEVGP